MEAVRSKEKNRCKNRHMPRVSDKNKFVYLKVSLTIGLLVEVLVPKPPNCICETDCPTVEIPGIPRLPDWEYGA